MCWNRFNAADDEEDIEVGHAGEAELDEIPTGNIHQIQLFQEITAGGVAAGRAKQLGTRQSVTAKTLTKQCGTTPRLFP